MPYKLCPNCSQSSYSANSRGVWKCPYCNQDITFVPATVVEKNNLKLKLEKRNKIHHLRLL